MELDLKEILAAFMVLFAIIDVPGSIPIILDIKNKGGDIVPMKLTLATFAIFLAFLVAGESLLGVFGVDISSFAIAGSFIIFLIGVEMVLGIELFKYSSSEESGVPIVPIAFPLLAGAGSITTIISLKAEYHTINIFIALVLNIVVVYFFIRSAALFERILGKGGLHVIKKFFGIILLAIAVKLFLTNTGIVINAQ
ncbi:MAG TPA: MarC family protein [Bacteroidetes bacterium]|nr:MarC family protein [Bacteroidota bacterium]